MSSSKKKERIPRVKQIGGYDLARYLPGGSGFSIQGGGRNPLDEIIQMQSQRLAAQAKEETVKAYIRQKQNEGYGNQNPSVTKFIDGLLTDPRVRKEWFAMDPSQQQTIASSVAMMSQQNSPMGGGNSNMGFFLPFMISQMSAKPQSSMKDMLELVGTINALQKGSQPTDSGIAMLTALMPLLTQRKEESSTGFFNTFLEFLKGELYRERRGPGLVDQLKQTRELAEIMGMNANADRNLEFEKLRYAYLTAAGNKNWEREQLRETLKNQRLTERERWKAIQNLGVNALNKATPLFEAFAKDLPEKLKGNPNQNASMQQQRAHQQRIQRAQAQRGLQQQSQRQQSLQPQQPPSGNPQDSMTASFVCPGCNTTIPIQGNPEEIVCPNCGTSYTKQLQGAQQ